MSPAEVPLFTYWILDDEDRPTPVAGAVEQGAWRVANPRRCVVGKSGWVLPDGQQVLVSTVFIGHAGILFETMVFGLGEDQRCERWATMAESLAGHERVVAETRAAIGDLVG